MTLKDGAFQVVDADGNALFKVKGQVFSLRERRVLVDGSDNPLVTFQQKVIIIYILFGFMVRSLI